VRIAVVGLGHIGLPLAVQYASRGHEVIGCDVDARIVESLNAGRSPHDDETAVSERIPELVAGARLRATTDDAEGVRGADAVVVIVPVVVDERHEVDFGPIDAATRDIARGLEPGTLVVYETTLPVGTTRDRFGPMLATESGLVPERDFFLAFSPERVLVGRVLLDLRRYPKIVGGIGDESTRRAAALYEAVLEPGTAVRAVANAETAEMTKLAETTYRDVNIALANEYARFAATRGIDVTEVIDAANSQPYSHIHQPGIGVGGHCIPVYPHFLINADADLRLPRMAREINDGMADWVVRRMRARIGSLERVPVLVLGIAYRADVREDAFSSAFRLRDELQADGARVLGHDPYFDADDLRHAGFEPWDPADPAPVRVAVLQAAHGVYADLDPAAIPGLELMIDGRNALDPRRWTGAGVTYAGIGR
jgi:nucleotide sugar dehydrogenase